jgi:hypothetical protein
MITQSNSEYIYPNKIKFSKIPAEVFSQSNMILNGLSSRASNRDVFKASCKLNVLKRLNHQPK